MRFTLFSNLFLAITLAALGGVFLTVASPVEANTDYTIFIYREASLDQAEQTRFDQATELLEEKGWTHEVRTATRDEVDELANVQNSIIPRFFADDPTAADFVSAPKDNNGGLRWLKKLVNATSAPADTTEEEDNPPEQEPEKSEQQEEEPPEEETPELPVLNITVPEGGAEVSEAACLVKFILSVEGSASIQQLRVGLAVGVSGDASKFPGRINFGDKETDENGVDHYPILFTTLNDNEYKGDTTLVVRLKARSTYTIGDNGQATVVILEDETNPDEDEES